MTANNIEENQLVFASLGGIGEIGMNCYLYGYGSEYDRQWLMIDLGITFASPKEPGIDVILPDTRFIEDERSNLCGLVLTHAHEDHYGAIIDLWENLQVPVYATPFTAAMLREKLAMEGMEQIVDLKVINRQERFELGPFSLELVDMAHSIPEPNAVLISTHLGTVLHTGDWKLDKNPITGPPTDELRLREIGKEGLDVLVCDSTNVLKEGVSISEKDVAETLQNLVGQAKNRIFVTTFASNLARVKSIAEAAYAHDRHVVLAGRALKRVVQVGKETGYIPDHYKFLSEDEFGYLPREKVLCLATGSQGESRAAMARMASGQHPRLSITKNDTVIFSSRTIPGNEKAVAIIKNALAEQDVHLIGDNDADVHVTGHPHRGELEKLYRWTRPNVAIPMHGEQLHLKKHRELAKDLGVAQVIKANNGDVVKLLPDQAGLIDELPTGRLYRDGAIILETDQALRERRKLSYAGHVALSLVIGKDGEIVGEPQWSLIGLPDVEDELDEIIENAIYSVMKSMPRRKRTDLHLLQEALRRSLRAEINSFWGKKVLASVHVHSAKI